MKQLKVFSSQPRGITVSNLDESVKFYEALTGTKIANRDEIGGKRMAQTQGLDDTLIKYANVHLENINIDLLEYVKPKSEKLLIPTNKLVQCICVSKWKILMQLLHV